MNEKENKNINFVNKWLTKKKKKLAIYMSSNCGDIFFFFFLRNPTEEMINDYFWDFMNLWLVRRHFRRVLILAHVNVKAGKAP